MGVPGLPLRWVDTAVRVVGQDLTGCPAFFSVGQPCMGGTLAGESQDIIDIKNIVTTICCKISNHNTLSDQSTCSDPEHQNQSYPNQG